MTTSLFIGKIRRYPAIFYIGDSLTGGAEYTNDLRSIRSTYASAVTAQGGTQPQTIYENMLALIQATPDLANYTALICAGTNGLSLADCQTYVPMMVGLLNHHRRFLILSAFNSKTAILGSAGWIAMKAINDWYDSAYPDNRHDDRAYLVTQNASPTDTANDVIGDPLRNVDGVHLSATGALDRAQDIDAALTAKDW